VKLSNAPRVLLRPALVAWAVQSLWVAGAAGAAEEPADEPPPASVPADEPPLAPLPADEPPSAPGPADEEPVADRFRAQLAADTVMRLFRYSTLPGVPGALAERLFAVPVYQYTVLRVRDLDVPWQPDSVDIELASWGSLHLGELGERQRIDGDISIASVRHRLGPAYVMVGRQVRAGGAARFVRLDGLSAGVRAPFGLGAEGYGGFAVLPRWSATPGYHLLGSAADTMLRAPEELPEPSREQHWLAGGRAYYALAGLGEVGASFHEQHEAGELGRRTLGFDLHASPHEAVSASALANVDLDAVEPLSLAAEYQHAVPALYLSRQSVLSVFSTDTFDEVGGAATYQPMEILSLSAGGYLDVFGDGSTGMRLVSRIRLTPLGSDRLLLVAGYRRVQEPESGYHGLRGAVGYRLVAPLMLTGETLLYLYDDPVRNALRQPAPETRLSWVNGLNADWSWAPGWSTLLGGSVSSTPYAAFDARAVARLRVDLGWGDGS
jgi:hypothetical protein